MQRLRNTGASAALIGLVALAGTARAQVVSTFDTTSESWSIVSFSNLSTNDYSLAGTYAPTYNTTGGNPGGYISTNDPDPGDFTFSAPSAFLGNQLGRTSLSYDLLHPTGVIDYQTTDVMLVGNGGERLLWERPAPITPGTSWISVSLGLSPSAAWHVNTTTGAAATTADFNNVLGSLTGLFIRGEYSDQVDTAGLDNVRLTSSAPEPASFCFLLGAAVPSAAFVRRRLRRS